MPIYFIGNGNGQVKIGYSRDPVARLPALQTGSPYPLELLAVKPGGQTVEAELHTKYANDRLEGEWFQLTPMLIHEIDAMQEIYPLESYLNQTEKDKLIWEDAYKEFDLAIDKLNGEYDLKIRELEEEIRRLNAERDAKEEELDQIFDTETKGIYPWWLEAERCNH